jgi:hypothetical protein
MSQPDTYSGGNRTGRLEYHSARGKLPRNSGNYTRRSQLIIHDAERGRMEFLRQFADI